MLGAVDSASQLGLRSLSPGLMSGKDAGMDPFSPDDGQYSEENFYTRSTDNKGHGQQIKVTVPPTLYAAVQRIVECREFPSLNTYASVARDGLSHRLRWLGQRVNDPPTNKSLLAAILDDEMQREMQQAEQARGYVETLQEFFRGAEKDDSKLAAALSNAMMMLDNLEGYPDLQRQIEMMIERYDYRVR